MPDGGRDDSTDPRVLPMGTRLQKYASILRQSLITDSLKREEIVNQSSFSIVRQTDKAHWGGPSSMNGLSVVVIMFMSWL